MSRAGSGARCRLSTREFELSLETLTKSDAVPCREARHQFASGKTQVWLDQGFSYWQTMRSLYRCGASLVLRFADKRRQAGSAGTTLVSRREDRATNVYIPWLDMT